MCGIAGLIDTRKRHSPTELQGFARKMANTMRYRGPDDSGVWVDKHGHCALSHRRLSIIDVSAGGHQPRATAHGDAAITFNGEIYNYLDLRKELEEAGQHFETQSDTEVLLTLVHMHGQSCLPALDAMYAFGYYDSSKGELLLARDPFGEKPVYYTHQNGYFGFASELHALFEIPNFQKIVDEEAVAEFLLYQYIPAPRTIFKNVFKIPPGHFLKFVLDGTISLSRHFEFQPQQNPDERVSLDALADELQEILLRSTKRRMISDVPLGTFLSGGVDSSTVVALATQALGRQVKTFSMGFPGSDESEHLFAREIAGHLRTEHYERLETPDIAVMVKRLATLLDEPNGDSSCLPTYLLSEFTAERVTVALSGDGGDEMFGGYGRYFATLNEYQDHLDSHNGAAGKRTDVAWTPGKAYLSSRLLIFSEEQLLTLYHVLPPEAAGKLAALRQFMDTSSMPLLARMRKLDMDMYMPGAVLAKVDRMSMQHSLEVRCPFLSIEVARFAERLAPRHCYRSGLGKLVLKEVASRFLPRAWLDRRKMGFGVPIPLWGKDDLLNLMQSVFLHSKRSMLGHWIPVARLNDFIELQRSATHFSAYQVWNLLILELWLQHHLHPRKDLEVLTGRCRQLFRSGYTSIRRKFNHEEFRPTQ